MGVPRAGHQAGTTIAEGVETEEQFREVAALDCDLAQGYLWSRPVEAAQMPDVMAACRPAAEVLAAQ